MSHPLFEQKLASGGPKNWPIWRVFVCPTCVPLWKLTTSMVKIVKRISVFSCFPTSGVWGRCGENFKSLWQFLLLENFCKVYTDKWLCFHSNCLISYIGYRKLSLWKKYLLRFQNSFTGFPSKVQRMFPVIFIIFYSADPKISNLIGASQFRSRQR